MGTKRQRKSRAPLHRQNAHRPPTVAETKRSLADLQPALGALPLGELLRLRLLLRLVDTLVLLLQDHLNVARARHVWVDATMCTVGTTAALLGPAHTDVAEHQILRVEVLEV